MFDARLQVPPPVNEPILSYAPASPERGTLRAALARLAATQVEVASRIGGIPVLTGRTHPIRAPHRHDQLLGHWHQCDEADAQRAIDSALEVSRSWAGLPFRARAAVFLRAAELLATKYRQVLNAATMLGQSKTAFQAEIDAACELIDFFRFNVAFAERILSEQPVSPPGVWNQLDYRPLEGFVLAVTPFNFTSIAANLPTAPCLLGNVVVWKPSPNAVYSAHFIMELLTESGLPPGVINVVFGDAEALVGRCLASPALAGVHFTGSTAVFRRLWATVGRNVGEGVYRTYPRLVGETGGKDFVFAHPSADIEALTVGLARGAYEYQGQKCSAASRAFVPSSLWPDVRGRLLDTLGAMTVGDPTTFGTSLGAVIDGPAWARLKQCVDAAMCDPRCEVLRHGSDDTVGYFVEPTLVRTDDPAHPLMRDELFGPVLTIFVYPDADLDRTLDLCDQGSPYGLTGAFFARDRRAIVEATARLRFAAGNFYVNDKPTGAVVGQQPFGGARQSGTNDKAGSPLNLLRWVSPRVVKETLAPVTDWRYPSLLPDG